MILLTPYHPSYLEDFVEWRSQPLSIRHNPLQAMTKTEIAETLESAGTDLSDLRRQDAYRWFLESDGVIVGTVALKNISHSMGYAEIGYGVGERYQGRGIATSAVDLLVRMCFEQTPLRKLLAYVHDQNTASRRVLRKVGFQQEGILREHYLIDGTPVDEILFGLLKRDWITAQHPR